MDDGVEDGREQAALEAEIAPETVEDELGDRGVAYEVGAAEDLEMPGDGGLREIEDRLEIRDEQWGGSQAIENAETGRLRDGDDEAGGRGQGGHMRNNEYTAR
jgi:hypothetical protein